MAGRYEAIVFDFDGVLVESLDVKTQAFASLYAEYGTDIVRKVIAYHLANGGVTRFKKFRYYHETLLGIPLTTKAEVELGQRFSCLVEDAVVDAPAVPGAMEFLERHAGTLPLFVASSTPEQELKRIVERRGMSRYFEDLFGAPHTKAEILVRISTQRRFTPDRVLMIGDARADYEGALAAGADFIGRGTQASGLFPPDVRLIPDLTALEGLI
jgi:HAD superfamily hydrolase (TIGR01549 family)